MIGRRTLLQATGSGIISSLISTRSLYARVPSDNRLILIFLRGGLDGLHAMPPYADPDYQKLRPSLSLNRPGSDNAVLDLDGYFGLHPALEPLHSLYLKNELALIPAAATEYRDRSHFDGQNMLENGSGKPYGARDGWLNRAILGLNDQDRRPGLALGPAIPLILQGEASIQTWSNSKLPEVDDDFLFRIGLLYQHDALFLDTFHDATGALKPDIDTTSMQNRLKAKEKFTLAARVAADLLSNEEGPRIAVMESQGWDTHFNQEGRLKGLFAELAAGMVTLKAGLGNTWSQTAILVISEFGRTAAENGSRGTDHGTGGLAMLAGGAVAGGKIVGKWPGLGPKALFEGRDVLAANRYEQVFKTLLSNHLGLSQTFIEERVFPNSFGIRGMEGLLRA